jgi:hypothetical protein
VIFRSIFRAFKQFLGFSGIVFALKINSKKRKKTYLPGKGRARRPDPLQPGRQARQGPSAEAAMAAAASGWPRARPYKKGGHLRALRPSPCAPPPEPRLDSRAAVALLELN